ncbi:MAG: ATP-binding cassette domain-containing protein [Ignavibacterium sp.]|uniref:ATP-binding cassette domain-containing protein n=1 Tax=Ignavibacterium sp. TaxID=2651167 RepID=UPI0040492065
MIKTELQKISIVSNHQERILLRDISFELKPNRIYTILGENGSGKSTLIKSLSLLLDNRTFNVEGKIFFNSRNLFELTDDELLLFRRKNIKYVFQDCVNSFDPLKTIGYYFNNLVDDTSKLSSLIEYFNLPSVKELSKLYPYELSGGMAQRVAIVIASISNPQLLIMDEPTSAADTAVINLLIHFLKNFVSKDPRTVLIVTQDLLFAEKVSDEIASIKNNSLKEFQPNN